MINIVKWKISSIIEKGSRKKWNITTIMVWVHWNEKFWVKALYEEKNNQKIAL